jgi:hypothetical protein
MGDNKALEGALTGRAHAVQETAADAAADHLSQAWRDFAESDCGTYSPLYAAICRSVADDPELLALAAAAPPSGRQPNVLLAAVHYLLLGGIAHPLADAYAARNTDLAPALFRDLCLSKQHDIARILASRHTQTNEPGRAALLAVGLAAAIELVGEPIGLLDAGCSAGLNLLIDRYRLEYGPAGGVGPIDSPVTINCELRRAAPVPTRLPAIAARLGIDRAPVDIANADDARWLLACVWPDTGRLARTAAAMELGRLYPPTVVAGDMVTDLDAAIDTFDPRLAIVVVTTSACGYLSAEQRREFLAILERRARLQPVAWLSVDAPGVLDLITAPPGIGWAGAAASVMGLVSFETGTATGRTLAICHGHGAWIEWAGATTTRSGRRSAR